MDHPDPLPVPTGLGAARLCALALAVAGLAAALAPEGQAADFASTRPTLRVGNGPAAESRLSAKAPPKAYRTAFFPRTAIEGFRKGAKIHLLDDLKGHTFVLAAYTVAAEANGRDLDSLGDRLKLPQGWKFRSLTLDRDLILEPKGGLAGATEDDLGDVYHLAGPGQSNFTP